MNTRVLLLLVVLVVGAWADRVVAYDLTYEDRQAAMSPFWESFGAEAERQRQALADQQAIQRN